MTSSQHHEIVLLPEVAARLRVSIGTVTRRLAERRKGIGDFPLPISKPGSKGRWLASDIDQYIALQKTSNAPDIDRKTEWQKRQERADEVLRQHGIEILQHGCGRIVQKKRV